MIDPNVLAILATTIVGFATNAITQYFTERRGKLEREDKAREMASRLVQTQEYIEDQLEKRAVVLAADTRRHVAETHSQIDQQTKTLVAQIAENTDISREAFVQANNVNEKIADLSAQILKQVKDNTPPPAQADRIEHVSADTNPKVSKIERRLQPSTLPK